MSVEFLFYFAVTFVAIMIAQGINDFIRFYRKSFEPRVMYTYGSPFLSTQENLPEMEYRYNVIKHTFYDNGQYTIEAMQVSYDELQKLKAKQKWSDR